MAKIIDWIDERTGLRALVGEALEEPVPGGARVRYVFGSVLTYLFMQQVVLGILLATYYSPSASDAWASTAYLQDQVAGGWFLRGLHHHGSSAMVVVTVLHLLQVVIAGAYRKPREFNWWTGLLMGGLVLAFALTGYLLPWDQKGYWATQVATGIMGTVPGGEPLQHVLQGGPEYGNLTITRFYALHVFVLPLLLSGLLGAHLFLFRRHGVTPPASMSEEELASKTAPFWPNQLFIDVVAMAVCGAVLVGLTYSTHGAELFAPADPASNFVARPEWYFLFLFQLLKYFEGPLALIATVIIPGAVAAFLFALPFIDRAESRSPKKRGPVLAGVGLIMAGVVALTVIAMSADANNEDYQEGLELADAEAETARELAKEGVPPAGGIAVWQNDPEYAAIMLFEENCGTCHEIDGKGGEEAPSLSHFNDREWLRGAVREPRSAAYFGGTKGHEDMEPYAAEDLPDEQLDPTIEYMLMLREQGEDEPNAAAYDAAAAKKGQALWEDELECSGCHEVEKGADGVGTPVLWGRGTRAWIASVIRNSSQAHLYGENAEMPKFEGKLSDEEIATLADYVYRQGWPAEDAAGAEAAAE
ncbi:cytochrome b N-terminal domain-containing protein [Pseudenhygromyxa sp. WMMC2535]|uniref:cytochrome b N-terminal domain-containing protein n=1 Tax=Pseudenhygromyxa sp. WMMC2535 TaxID=2712867 RepID=UPI001555F6B9|nr:cytochrome b N-terminal domain-containing protein [Pseudenhygromyxa sp. WMMC2535]NVB40284.1 cytochrome b N-terminal domain-containing protein [Pseudenhygromyxa sp. WMMC2535]